MARYADRVAALWTGTGTGTVITIGGTPDGTWQSFANALVDGETTDIAIYGAAGFECCEATWNESAGQLTRGTIYTSSNAGARVNFGAGQKIVTITLPASKALAFQPALAAKNILINGDHIVSQENGTTAKAIPTGTQFVNATDQWGILKTGTSVLAAQQIDSTISGHTKSLKITVTTAQASIGSDVVIVEQRIEGLRIAEAQWGTAAAVPITIAFKAKFPATGTFNTRIVNAAQTHASNNTFTVAAANTEQFFTVVFPVQTGGVWPKDNSYSASFDIYIAGNGTLNAVGNTSFVTEITGAVAIPGTHTLTSTQNLMRGYAYELLEAQRYFWRPPVTGITQPIIKGGVASSATVAEFLAEFPRPMRVSPTLSISAGTHFGATTASFGAINAGTGLALNGQVVPGMTARMTLSGTSGLVAGDATWLYSTNASAALAFDARM